MAIEITTNNQPRELLAWMDLTEKERKEFDYILPEEHGEFRFFRYRGQIFDFEQFMPIGSVIRDRFPGGWNGYASDTYFSGHLIRFVEDGDAIVVGRFVC